MRKVFQYLAFTLVLAAAAIVTIQFIPPVSKALALVAEFEAARVSQDAQKVSNLLAPDVLSGVDRARKSALSAPERDVRNLPFGDKFLVLTLRSAVLEKRLEYRILRDGSPAALHVAMLQANAKLAGTPAPVTIPLFGIPTGPGRVSVWIGPAEVPSLLGYGLAVLWNIRGEVITTKDGKSVYDPSIMLRASERENARLLGSARGPQADAVLFAYLRYKGEAQKIWQPLNVSRDQAN
jgi:hypothetical protein